MAFDLNYYEGKRTRLNKDFVKTKDRALRDMISIVAQFLQEQSKFELDIREVTTIINENTRKETTMSDEENVVVEEAIAEDGSVEETLPKIDESAEPAAEEAAPEEAAA